ncbi:hypothetical protein BGZ83_009724, partial [Gryganskiella cystojenkinii]
MRLVLSALVAQSMIALSFLNTLSVVSARPTSLSSSSVIDTPAVPASASASTAAPFVLDHAFPNPAAVAATADLNFEASSAFTNREASSSSSDLPSWNLPYMPAKISDLKKALHLEDALTKKDEFDIVPDPKPDRKVKRAGVGKKHLVLRSLYPKNSYSQSKDRHASFTSTPLPTSAFTGTSHYIRLEYQMMFEPGFNWVKGGKLPGILVGSEQGSGGGNTGCSGGGSAENCFSTRMMWRANGEGELYLYAARSVYFPSSNKKREDEDSEADAVSEWCSRNRRCSLKRRLITRTDPEEEAEARRVWEQLERQRIDALRLPEPDDEFSLPWQKRDDASCLDGYGVKTTPGSENLCNEQYGISVGRGGKFQFKSGQWHNITQVVRVNSAGNKVKDGYLAVYLDGLAVVQSSQLVLLKNGYTNDKNSLAHTVKFMFSSFFGGHTSDYKTPTAQWIAWKDFSMTTSPTNVWSEA